MNCYTCTGGVSACTTCDVSASPPQFLREDDSYCVLEAECDQTAAYYWDTTVDNEGCAGNYVFIMNKNSFRPLSMHYKLLMGMYNTYIYIFTTISVSIFKMLLIRKYRILYDILNIDTQ